MTFTPNADRAEALAEHVLSIAVPESAVADLARAVLMLATETRDVQRSVDATLRVLTSRTEHLA